MRRISEQYPRSISLGSMRRTAASGTEMPGSRHKSGSVCRHTIPPRVARVTTRLVSRSASHFQSSLVTPHNSEQFNPALRLTHTMSSQTVASMSQPRWRRTWPHSLTCEILRHIQGAGAGNIRQVALAIAKDNPGKVAPGERIHISINKSERLRSNPNATISSIPREIDLRPRSTSEIKVRSMPSLVAICN